MKKELVTWYFGTNNNNLVDLVLTGKKTATTYIYNGNIDEIGTESILIYNDKKYACVTRTVKNIITEFKNIDWDLAKLEGENSNLEEWRKQHINYFKSIDNNFTEDTKVVVEVFEVVKVFQGGDNNMKIYIDFDGTLFDTDKYMSDFMDIFNQYGINSVIFDEVRANLFNDEKLFNLDIIIDYFIEKYNVDIELKYKIDNLLTNSYVYPEVIDCLNILINSGFELYLLTYGDALFQLKKIEASNLSGYFKGIIITDKDKSELNLDYKNSIFIDNNPIVIEKLYESKAKKLIRIKRKSDRYTKDKCNVCNIMECSDFNDVSLYMKGGFNNE